MTDLTKVIESVKDEKNPLYNVYANKNGMTDVSFVSKEVITPALLNRSLRSISVRYRQYLRDIRKTNKMTTIRSIENGTTAKS